jgi:hypothetical protein
MHTSLFKMSWWLGLVLLLTGSGCLTIEEHYRFKRNGSGSMEFLIDLSEAAAFLGEDESPAGWGGLSLQGVGEALEGIEGISKVEVQDDSLNQRYQLNFAFKHLQALNRALTVIHLRQTEGEPFAFFTQEDNQVVRHHRMNSLEVAEEFLANDASGQVADLLRDMDYRVYYQFPKPIQVAYTVAEVGFVGKRHKGLRQVTDLYTLLEETSALDASIILK